MDIEEHETEQRIYPIDQMVRSWYPVPSASRWDAYDVVQIPVSGEPAALEYIDNHYLLQKNECPDQAEINQSIPTAVRSYYNDTVQSAESRLREHQSNVFEDLATHFEEGNTKGYIELPTGTGKTVIFVALSEALLHGPPELKPKILVVAPTKDLVEQTIGKTGNKGFGAFAPEVTVSSYFSDSANTRGLSRQDRVKQSDVCVTTYSSFNLMFEDVLEGDFLFQYDKSGKQIYKLPNRNLRVVRPNTNKKVIDLFNVIIFDEAHRTLGASRAPHLEKLDQRSIPMIGFTATPNFSEQRRLETTLGKEIHQMDTMEAIEQQLLSPLICFSIASDASIDATAYNRFTDQYRDKELAHNLAHNELRNNKITEAAKILVESGVGTIISCLAGEEMIHPSMIAEQLNKTMIRDPETSEMRYARFASIDSSVELSERQKIYTAFEAGEIDGMTYINILTEGWDSQRAKGLINARPSRSKLFAKQRLGRILRATDDFNPAIVIDIQDNVGRNKIHPVNTSDLLDEPEVDVGKILASSNYSELEQLTQFRDTLIKVLQSNHSIDLVPQSPQYSIEQAIKDTERKGVLENIVIDVTDENGSKLEEITFSTVSGMEKFDHLRNMSNSLMERLENISNTSFDFIERKNPSNGALEKFFDLDQVLYRINTLPEVNPAKYVVDKAGEKWVTTLGLQKLISTKYPAISTSEIENILSTLQTKGKLGYEPPIVRYTIHRGPNVIVPGIAELFKLSDYKLVLESYLSEN